MTSPRGTMGISLAARPDWDDEVGDVGPVESELRFVTGAVGGNRVPSQLAAPEVLEQDAEIGLGQAGRYVIAVGRIGAQGDTGAGREILERGSHDIVIDDVGEPDRGSVSSQAGSQLPGNRDPAIIPAPPDHLSTPRPGLLQSAKLPLTVAARPLR